MHIIRITAAALCLGACTYQANVPMADGRSLGSVGSPQPGRYLVLLQSGGWDMKTQIEGMSCWANNYKADLNLAWDQAMRAALAAALQTVDFTAEVVPAAELGHKGYDAEIAFTQSNAVSKMRVVPHFFFGATGSSETTLDGILNVTYPDGRTQQEALQGRGTSSKEVFLCGDVAPAVGDAGGQAVRDIVQRAATTTKLLLAQNVRH
jgi:hypothetical protein